MVETIGERIRIRRHQKGLTQAQVADQLFVTQQTVARWERGHHTPPVTAIQDLARLLDVESSYFFGEDKVVTRHFNFFALFGSLTFNFLFFWLAAVVLISTQLALWGTAGVCLLSPVIILWQNWAGLEVLTFGRLLGAIVAALIVCLLRPLLWQETRHVKRLLRAYYRYNVDAVVYQVVAKAPDRQ
ncbi:helix-turn-helix transcriptional regulator [Lacticaseibacillus absianus]|uniref:helix-turn-helix transcriptional regulator n=1 Tax=Lacticaseibacillus absianus TaxID=2729623 RepID=UPI0015C7F4F2|nr:helix-turn-helix transcriptional regulator [Lacticaseibacillus absianus]